MLTDMLRHLQKQWGWIALRGVVAVLFGVIALAMPAITLAALVITWGIYAVADGIVALVVAWQARHDRQHFWWFLGSGLLSIAAGVATFVWPGITQLVLLMVIAGWAVGTGVFQIGAAILLRKEIQGEWALGLSGALSVLFGLMMIVSPGAGALAVVWLIAGYAIAFGVLLIVLGFRLRSYGTRHLATA